eukprot:scaffold1666_cov424-Prasinococcus_capsulatus_cf.AAC.3
MPSCIVYAFSLALSLQVLGGRSEDAAPSPGLSALAAAKSSSSDPNEIAGLWVGQRFCAVHSGSMTSLRPSSGDRGYVAGSIGAVRGGRRTLARQRRRTGALCGGPQLHGQRILQLDPHARALLPGACAGTFHHNTAGWVATQESFFGPFRGPRPWGHERATNWSALALRECQEVADEGLSKGGRRLMFHIKPSQLLKYGVTGDQAMRDIHNNTNIRTAVFLYRHNKLAEWVSYAELRPLARQEFWGAKEGPATQNLVHEWEEICTHCEEAEKAAADLGMRYVRILISLPARSPGDLATLPVWAGFAESGPLRFRGVPIPNVG